MSKNEGISINLSLGGLCTILTIVFLVLKLCGVIAWSWWLVFLPLIIEVGLVLLIILICVIIVIVAVIKERKEE